MNSSFNTFPTELSLAKLREEILSSSPSKNALPEFGILRGLRKRPELRNMVTQGHKAILHDTLNLAQNLSECGNSVLSQVVASLMKKSSNREILDMIYSEGFKSLLISAQECSNSCQNGSFTEKLVKYLPTIFDNVGSAVNSSEFSSFFCENLEYNNTTIVNSSNHASSDSALLGSSQGFSTKEWIGIGSEIAVGTVIIFVTGSLVYLCLASARKSVRNIANKNGGGQSTIEKLINNILCFLSNSQNDINDNPEEHEMIDTNSRSAIYLGKNPLL